MINCQNLKVALLEGFEEADESVPRLRKHSIICFCRNVFFQRPDLRYGPEGIHKKVFK